MPDNQDQEVGAKRGRKPIHSKTSDAVDLYRRRLKDAGYKYVSLVMSKRHRALLKTLADTHDMSRSDIVGEMLEAAVLGEPVKFDHKNVKRKKKGLET